MQVGHIRNIDPCDKPAVKSAFFEMERAISAERELAWGRLGPAVPTSPLYHYTTGAGLDGIICSGSLYLTNAFYLNDKTELTYARDLAADVIAERARSAPPTLHRFFAQRLVGFDPFTPNSLDFACYLASFCERSDLLSQWRTYGGSATGYALGFAVDPFADRANFADATAPHTALIRVEYDRQKQKSLIELVLDRCCEMLAADLTAAATELERKLLETGWFSVLAIQLTELFPRFKNALFHEEHEWRLGCFMRGDADDAYIKFRAVGADLIPYLLYSVALKTTNRLPLTEIVIGPAAELGIQTRTLAKFLRAKKYPDGTVQIIEPAVPLRLR